ncbi:MAG: UDP-N-acetylmuramoyl-L-alanine--D-glutamate ligase [Bacteroidota bacterium]|nr:UDP-N-acetylmuramoyl-L-alanine--D-glutamate ligase [Bacteroidota bacterium]
MIVIIGGGESGVGAALLAKANGIVCFLSDESKINEKNLEELIENEIDFESGVHELVYDIQPEFVVISPGVPEDAPVIKVFKERAIDIISEIEFAFRYCRGVVLAITGSNGKTTTTNLIYHILETNNLTAVKCGNVGYSFSRAVSLYSEAYFVVEVSSFQLDGIRKFKPNVAILLNITPDHLDRYHYNFEKYIFSKFKIFKNLLEGDLLIINKQDPVIARYFIPSTCKAIIKEINCTLDEAELVYNGIELMADLSMTNLKGKHNAINASASIEALKFVGLNSEQIQMGLNSFVNDAHRLESVGIIEGVEYINDSKATNVDSVYWALDTMKKRVIWIAGGQDKGNDYSVLQSLVKLKVKALIALGANNEKIMNSFEESSLLIVNTNNMSDAVKEATSVSEPGDVVLLSPACASFDLFNNYEHRGNCFKAEVKKLNNISL